jgi:hypothetical protein
MIVREFLTRLGFDADESKVRSFDGAVKGLVGGLTLAVGAMKAVNAAAFALAANAAKVGDEAAKTGRQLGITAEAVQEYRFAFDRLGVSEGEATSGMERFSRALGRAAQGSKSEAAAFEALGLNIRDADGQLRGMEELLPEAADGLAAITNEAERAAVAQDLFGRSGGRLAMALSAGGDEIRDLREEFRLLGGGLTNEQAKAAEEFTDTLTNLRTVLNGIKLQIGAELMPVFRPMMQAFTEFVALNRRGIIEGIASAFGEVSRVMQNLTGFVMDVFGGFSRLFGLFGEGEDMTRNLLIAFGALLFIFRRKAAIFLAFLAVVDDFLAWQQGQESVIGKLIGSYDSWAERLSTLADRFGGLETIAKAASYALGAVVAVKLAAWLWGAAMAAKAFAFAMLANPVAWFAAGAVLAVLALIDLYNWVTGNDSAIGRLLGSYEDFKDRAAAFFAPAIMAWENLQSAADKFMDGDWVGGAANILKALGNAFMQGIDLFNAIFIDPILALFGTSVADMAARFGPGLQVGFDEAVDFFANMVAALRGMWDRFVAWAREKAKDILPAWAVDLIFREGGSVDSRTRRAPRDGDAPEPPATADTFDMPRAEPMSAPSVSVPPANVDVTDHAPDVGVDAPAAFVSVSPANVDVPDFEAQEINLDVVAPDFTSGIANLQDYLEGLASTPSAPNAEAVAGGNLDQSKVITLNAPVTQNITVPPGTTSEQLAVIRAEAQRTIDREIRNAATSLEG